MEKIDLTKCYEELDECINKDDHTEALNISTKILNSFPNEKEAFKAKITALISLSKGEELVVQTALDGFEIDKYTDINAKYEKCFEK